MCYIDDVVELGWMTPLYSICMERSPRAHHIVACLLSAGADPNLRPANQTGDPDSEDDSSSDHDSNSTPLQEALCTILGNDNGSVSVVARLLKAGASLDNPQGLSAEETIAKEERFFPTLAADDRHFKAAAILIRGVRAAGSWKKYCRRRGPHRDILRLRSFVVRGRATTSDEWLAGTVRLKENGLVWKVLSFWRDADDIEDLTLGNGDVVRVYD